MLPQKSKLSSVHQSWQGKAGRNEKKWGWLVLDEPGSGRGWVIKKCFTPFRFTAVDFSILRQPVLLTSHFAPGMYPPWRTKATKNVCNAPLLTTLCFICFSRKSIELPLLKLQSKPCLTPLLWKRKPMPSLKTRLSTASASLWLLEMLPTWRRSVTSWRSPLWTKNCTFLDLCAFLLASCASLPVRLLPEKVPTLGIDSKCAFISASSTCTPLPRLSSPSPQFLLNQVCFIFFCLKYSNQLLSLTCLCLRHCRCWDWCHHQRSLDIEICDNIVKNFSSIWSFGLDLFIRRCASISQVLTAKRNVTCCIARIQIQQYRSVAEDQILMHHCKDMKGFFSIVAMANNSFSRTYVWLQLKSKPLSLLLIPLMNINEYFYWLFGALSWKVCRFGLDLSCIQVSHSQSFNMYNRFAKVYACSFIRRQSQNGKQ